MPKRTLIKFSLSDRYWLQFPWVAHIHRPATCDKMKRNGSFCKNPAKFCWEGIYVRHVRCGMHVIDVPYRYSEEMDRCESFLAGEPPWQDFPKVKRP